jgi:hypothetical protein
MPCCPGPGLASPGAICRSAVATGSMGRGAGVVGRCVACGNGWARRWRRMLTRHRRCWMPPWCGRLRTALGHKGGADAGSDRALHRRAEPHAPRPRRGPGDPHRLPSDARPALGREQRCGGLQRPQISSWLSKRSMVRDHAVARCFRARQAALPGGHHRPPLLDFHLCQRRLRSGEPARHVHSAV